MGSVKPRMTTTKTVLSDNCGGSQKWVISSEAFKRLNVSRSWAGTVVVVFMAFSAQTVVTVLGESLAPFLISSIILCSEIFYVFVNLTPNFTNLLEFTL